MNERKLLCDEQEQERENVKKKKTIDLFFHENVCVLIGLVLLESFLKIFIPSFILMFHSAIMTI